MTKHLVVIGAGIIGASVAWHAARRGARVTVVEAGPIAGAASGRSFGWLNASFHANEDHFHLRCAAMEAWKRWEAKARSGAVNWCGALCWDVAGAEMDALRDKLRNLEYPVDIIERGAFQMQAPGVAAPERALVFASEGAVDLAEATRAMLRGDGIRVVSGCAVREIEVTGDRVTGLRLEAGRIDADAVVVAAGVAAPGLVEPLGVRLPMLQRPGLMLKTRPVAPVIRQVLVSPGMEIRQDASGRILAPTAAGHQGDSAERIGAAPADVADAAMARLRAVLPGLALEWDEVVLAHRPVPGDGLPVIGRAGPEGLYLTVMHSGATLGALVGEMAAEEVLTGSVTERLAPYRPERFQSARS
jgi:glycine/D-amino acid oxidase-like deaminating enzyme